MNNLVIATNSMYFRCHKVYRATFTSYVVPAVYKWSWRKFRFVEIKPEKIKYKMTICHSIYNEVTKKLENDTYECSFSDQKYGLESFKTACEQWKNQDPTLRYVDDALQDALKGAKDD